jgi:hypothetical protein
MLSFTVLEIQRVRAMISSINQLTAVVPRGSLVPDAHNTLVPNKLFSGARGLQPAAPCCQPAACIAPVPVAQPPQAPAATRRAPLLRPAPPRPPKPAAPLGPQNAGAEYPDKLESYQHRTALPGGASLAHDVRGCWALHWDAFRGVAVLRSLLAPGYCFYYNAAELSWGGFYQGDGLRNRDLIFML